jgi:hydrogenase small subunit
MPFMNQPPGSLLSAQAVTTYGRMVRALRNFTQGSLNKVPSWRRARDDRGNVTPGEIGSQR